MKNTKTTIGGVLATVGLVLLAVGKTIAPEADLLLDEKSIETIGSLVAALGLLVLGWFARDAEKKNTAGTVPAEQEKPKPSKTDG